VSALVAQSRAEVTMTLRRGESLLLTVGIPVLLLVFFSAVSVVSVPGTHRVDFVAPGVLSLCVMSTAMVSLGIATGFERGYGVLKRLFVTPLGRGRLLAAKVAGVAVVVAIQAAVVCAVAGVLGWQPNATALTSVCAVVAVVLGVVAFGGIGLALAGRLRPEANLAAANGLYLVLLLTGGMVVPFSKLPGAVAAVAKVLPSGALTVALRDTLSASRGPSLATWLVLIAWAIAAPLLAALTFRFEPPR
jgi:ABC-2 type transport system permease protein